MPYHQRLITEIKPTIMSTCVATERAAHTHKRKVHQGQILYFATEQDRPWNPRSVLMFQLDACKRRTFKLLWCCCCYPSGRHVHLVLYLLFYVVFSSKTTSGTSTVLASRGFGLTLPRWYLPDRWFCTFDSGSASIPWLFPSKSLSRLLPLRPPTALTGPVIFQQALNISDSRFSRGARKNQHLKSQLRRSLTRFRADISCVELSH